MVDNVMHVCHLASNPPIGAWVVDWSRAGECDYDDMDAVIETHRPVLQLSLNEASQALSEMNYKELARAIDPNFLDQGRRARALRGVYYQGFFNPNAANIQQQRITDTMWFKVTSSLHAWNGLDYDCFVKFLAWTDIGSDADLTAREKSLLMLWTSDIQLDCNDKSFKYYGYLYILNQLGAAIRTNDPAASMYPRIRNPNLQGVVCKHLNRVLKALPFHSGDIAKEITNQFGGKLDQQTLQDIENTGQLSIQANQDMGTPPEIAQPEEEQEYTPPGTIDQRVAQYQQDQNPTEKTNENRTHNRSSDRRFPTRW